MNPSSAVPLPIAVLDINVFVSGTTIAQGPPAQVINLWRQGRYEVATSELLLARMRQVYLYPKVTKVTRMREGEIDEFLHDIRQSAIVVAGTTPVNVCKDPEDNVLFATALEAHAHYIVSGDQKHVLPIGSYQGIRTLSPAAFLKELRT